MYIVDGHHDELIQFTSLCFGYNSSMKKQFTAVVWQEWNRYVAQCLEIDVSSYGTTHDEALQMLKEALELVREDGGDMVISVTKPSISYLDLSHA